VTGIVLVAAGLIILDPAARTQTNIGTPPLDRLPASRTGAVRSDDRTVAKDAPLELMITASAAGNCRDVKGNFTEVFSPQNSVATGNIYNAGWLNAATEARFDTAVFPTPDPNKFSYGGPVTIATARGVLKGRRVYLTRRGQRIWHGHDGHRSQGRHRIVRRGNRHPLRARQQIRHA